MRKLALLLLLVVVPLVVVPWAVTFDAAKSFALVLGVLVPVAMALPRRDGDGGGWAPFELRRSAVTVAGLVLVIAMAAACARAVDPWAAWRHVALLASALVAALVVENSFLVPEELHPFLRALAAVQGLVSVYGLVQAAGHDFPFPWMETHAGMPVATLGNPNFAAEWVAAALPLTLLVAWRERGLSRLLALGAIVAGCLFLKEARGRVALVSLVLGGTAALGAGLLASRRRVLGGATLALAVVTALGGMWLMARDGGALPPWMGRSDTVVVRVELARSSMAMLADNPLGVGPGNWEVAVPPYRSEREVLAALRRDPGEAHDEYLQTAAEGGWPALLALLAALGILAHAGWSALRVEGGDRGASMALLATAAITLAEAGASAPMHRPASLLLFAFAAGGLAFLSGRGRFSTHGRAAVLLHGTLILLLAAGSLLLGSRMAGEGRHAEGLHLLRQGKALEARDALLAAAERDPGAARALALAGRVTMAAGAGLASAGDGDGATGLFEEARTILERARALRPLDPGILVDAAVTEAGCGDGAAARSLFEEALRIAPWHRDAHTSFAGFLLDTGEPGEALVHAERAVELDPLHGPALGARVVALLREGHQAEAMESASKAVDSLVTAPDARLPQAAALATRVAREDVLLAAMLVGKAGRMADAGQAEAAAALALAVATVSPDEGLLESAARALETAGRSREAAHLRVEARFRAAEAALAAGDRDLALLQAERAAQVPVGTMESLRVRVRRAGILTRAGKREAALVELKLAFSRGFRDIDAVARDPAFAGLAEDPAFLALLAEAGREK